MLNKNSKIHIVGGTGAMGTWLRVFLESLNLSVSISDEKTKPLDLSDKNIVFISVPIEISGKIISETVKKTNKNCLIVDLSSVMSINAEVIKQIKQPAMSLHFLFGPTVSSIKNQKIIFNTYGDKTKAKDLLTLLEKEGAKTVEMDFKSHDFQMAHVQSLTHFINLCFAKTLIEDKIGLKGDISTPIFLSQLSTSLRVLAQNPRLISEIQTLNPQFAIVLKNFIEMQKEIAGKIKNKNVNELAKKINILRQNLESVSGETEIQTVANQKKLRIKNLKIGYLGPKGTFSNQAAEKMFNERNNNLISQKNIYDLFRSLEKEETDLIIAPAENTIEGTVRETLDLLTDYNFKIIGKIDLMVSQCLLSKGKDIKSIKKIISHPQALNQSGDFIAQNLPNAILESSDSTLSAMEKLKDSETAIIGSELAAKIYNLNILKKDIQNNLNNVTRFYIISKRDILKLKNRTKSLLFLSVFNRVGILRDILGIFADLSINLNKIESRPSREKNWDYYFYIEIELTDDDPKFNQALNILKQYCPEIRILGML